jgi:hypothetical protein
MNLTQLSKPVRWRRSPHGGLVAEVNGHKVEIAPVLTRTRTGHWSIEVDGRFVTGALGRDAAKRGALHAIGCEEPQPATPIVRDARDLAPEGQAVLREMAEAEQDPDVKARLRALVERL